LSDILLSHEVSINLFIELILFLLLCVALFHTIFILKRWKHNTTTSYQYALEKRSYLVLSIISFVLVSKIALLIFFTYTLNELSTIIPGAMCAAGVVKSNIYGNFTLIIKLFVIMLILLWMTLNKGDQRAKNHPFFKQKLYFFIFIFIFIAVELFLEILFFTNISTQTPVLCCSTIYNTIKSKNPLPFNLSTKELITLFYLCYIFILSLCYTRKKILLSIFSLLYVYIAYHSIVYFFGLYIYELPTHKCPFCMLQSDYYYIGYLIFGSLFVATYYSLKTSLFSFSNTDFYKTTIYYTIFILSSSLCFWLYIFKNGVLL